MRNEIESLQRHKNRLRESRLGGAFSTIQENERVKKVYSSIQDHLPCNASEQSAIRSILVDLEETYLFSMMVDGKPFKSEISARSVMRFDGARKIDRRSGIEISSS